MEAAGAHRPEVKFGSMTTADQLEVVNRKLSSCDGGGGGVEALALAEGGLVQGWMKARRLLVIVRSSKSHAVFVFLAKSLPVGNESDIEVESVLPIKHDFKCVIPNCIPSSITYL